MIDEFDINPDEQVAAELKEALSDLRRPLSAYHTMPWKDLDKVVGGMPGGEVCYIAAFSSSGKTTFLTSLTDHLFETTEKKIYYMGLEARPKTLRTHWACKRLGLDAGDFLSGEYMKYVWWKEQREKVETELLDQMQDDKFDRVRFCPTPHIDADTIYKAAKQAYDFGAEIFIIDHVDHIDGAQGNSGYQASRQVVQAILNIAQEYGFLMIPATQLNNEAVAHNRISLYLPPQPQHIKFGGHKRETATWMLGLYRPLKLTGADEAAIKAVNAGMHPNPTSICEPNTMAVVIMKHRFYGNREWKRVYLGVEKGKVIDRKTA